MTHLLDLTAVDGVDRLTVLISGANSGIGLATASWFARRGARVLFLARTEAKARAAAELVGSDRSSCYAADYARFSEIRMVANQILQESDRLDIVINNAGRLISHPAQTTEDGHPESLQINYLSHFLLTSCLLEALLLSPRPRVVNLSSKLHRIARGLDLHQGTTGAQTPVRAFAEAKALMVAFTAELNRRFGVKGLVSRAIHPGIARSNIPDTGASLLLKLAGLLMIDSSTAAQNVVRAALLAPEDCVAVYLKGAKPARALPLCLDPAFGQKLWHFSLNATQS